MLRIITSAILILILLLSIILIWYDQDRRFYCVEGNCITLWKRLGGNCYIVNGRYYRPFKPTNISYLQTVNWEVLALYFNKKMPRQIIIMDKEDSKIDGKHFTVHNISADGIEFVAYRDEYKALLYPPNTLKHEELTPETTMIYINILDSYATSNREITK